MGGTQESHSLPAAPRSAAPQSTAPDTPPPSSTPAAGGLPGTGGTDGFGGFGRTFLKAPVGRGQANAPDDVHQASTFLHANGILPAPTRDADEGFLRGVEKGQEKLNALSGGGLQIDGIAKPVVQLPRVHTPAPSLLADAGDLSSTVLRNGPKPRPSSPAIPQAETVSITQSRIPKAAKADPAPGTRPRQAASAGQDLAKFYAERGIDPQVGESLAKTGVVPQVAPELRADRVTLIRDILRAKPEDFPALRRRITEELAGDAMAVQDFHRELTNRDMGQSEEKTTAALLRHAVKSFGREIDPQNAGLLADVLNATPDTKRDVLLRINKRFGGLSGDGLTFNETLNETLRFKASGGEEGLSPRQAAEKLMPYVDGRKAGQGKLAVKAMASLASMFGGGLPMLVRAVIGGANNVDTARTLVGTFEKRRRAEEEIKDRN
tara:strand:- start:1310 stop:2617 length:1308 start_codon:yes stop_codon:yes gene_type:complete